MTDGTAWFGFCYHCMMWFNNHKMSCPTLTVAIPSTSANPVVWPVTPVPNAAAANPVGWTYTIQAG